MFQILFLICFLSCQDTVKILILCTQSSIVGWIGWTMTDGTFLTTTTTIPSPDYIIAVLWLWTHIVHLIQNKVQETVNLEPNFKSLISRDSLYGLTCLQRNGLISLKLTPRCVWIRIKSYYWISWIESQRNTFPSLEFNARKYGLSCFSVNIESLNLNEETQRVRMSCEGKNVWEGIVLTR
jgi:hypothetical protein